MKQFVEHTQSLKSANRRSRDEKTQAKIHRHLTDINDRITDQDILDIDIFSFLLPGEFRRKEYMQPLYSFNS